MVSIVNKIWALRWKLEFGISSCLCHLRSRVTSSDTTTERVPGHTGKGNNQVRHSCHWHHATHGNRDRDTVQGPAGLWAPRASVSRFFDYRKQPSVSLQDLPWVPVGRIQAAVNQGRRGCKAREKQSRAALRQGPVSPSVVTQPLWAALQILTLLKVGEVNG